MLSLSPAIRIFVARDSCDMRKGFDGLSSLVIDVIGEDPQSGHLFVFVNKRRNRIKTLIWDGSGYVLLYKRLEHGRFHFFDRAVGKDGAYELRASEFTLLLEGIDLRGSRRRLTHDEMTKFALRA